MHRALCAVRIVLVMAMVSPLAAKVLSGDNLAAMDRIDQVPATPGAATTDFRVTLLGTATHGPRPDRFGASTLVEAGSERLVFDCGRSCTTRLWQLKIPLGTVKLFITHLHADHTVGIPDLWLTGWLPVPYGGRREPFRV
jgi:ribonuclease Z